MMPYLRETPHSIKIHPAVTLPLHDGKQRPLNRITDEVYNHLLDHATFNYTGQKASSCFITRQRIAEKLQLNLSIIYQAIRELIHAERLKQHQDGYLILIKEENV